MSKFRYITAACSLLLAMTIFIPASNAQNDLVTNGSFETGNFTGWTRQSISTDGDWLIYSGTSTPIW